MFVTSVKTPRNVTVDFGLPPLDKRNHISLLTGPNGCGKTDALASIAQIFHGRAKMGDAFVKWNRGSRFHISTASRQTPEERQENRSEESSVRLIAQTFSPFSRFPSVKNLSSQSLASIYSRGDESHENYISIGFNQKSRIELRVFSFSIIEKAILRLSERPKSAKVAFEVLEDLGFKEGISLQYVADPKLFHLIELMDDSDRLERVLESFRKTGEIALGNRVYGGRTVQLLHRELRGGDIYETAEYLRHAVNMISNHISTEISFTKPKTETYSYTAFQDRGGMSSDFAYLQAFSVLTRLNFLKVESCELQPIGGDAVDIRRASSGQQQMLCSIFGLAAAVSDEAIILIDEPELSLHPRWQMQFFKYLETILESVKGCHAIIATHSPLLAQAAAQHKIQIISMGKDSIDMKSTLPGQAESNSVEKMLVDVFETPIPDSLHISKEVFSLVTISEGGTAADQTFALSRLKKYLDLYRHHGEGSREMTSLLEKAVNFVERFYPEDSEGSST